MASVTNTINNKKGYNQLVLRGIGIICTVIGTVQIAMYPANAIMGLASWVGFAIFAFLLTEGLNHSMGKVLYGTRLFLFAAIAEIPFNLASINRYSFTRIQNPLFTLFIGFLMMAAVDAIRKKADNLIITILAEVVFTIFGTYLMKGLGCMFSSFAMVYIMMFYIAGHIHYPKVFELVICYYIAFYISTQTVYTLTMGGFQYDITTQAVIIPTLLLIWLYNGKRGPNSIPLRYASYGYLPVLFLICWLMANGGK